MAHFTKATSVKDWFNQCLAVDKVEKVLASEYWIPKNINFLWAMGMILVVKSREMIWISSMLLFVAFSAEAFSGYMLYWGQMSYWAGMVITKLFSGGSLHADGLVEWIRGDYVPAQAFLNRFFMLHVLLIPVAILGLIGLHFDGEEIDFDAESKKCLASDKAGSKVIRFANDFI